MSGYDIGQWSKGVVEWTEGETAFLSVVFIPVLYVTIRTLAPGKTHRGLSDEDLAAERGGAHV